MSNAPKNATERAFQESFTRELEKYKWEAPDALNGNLHKVTVDDLIANWRRELNRINADMLEGVELTDGEFQQVMEKVNAIPNSFEAAKLLAMENGQGKIDGIFRDPNPNLTREQITLTIFRKADVRGGESSYQIAREVQGTNNNRFDMILLICGLPLINIEMKRSDHSLDEAFEQFKRYYKDGEYIHGFLAFSQMMVVCSEIETRYFATPKSLSWFNPAFAFHWSDKYNRISNDWRKIVSEFLMVPMAHQMVGDYLVIYDDKERPEESCHMVMRPYQVYALQAVELAAFGQDGKCDGFPHGGFVWHTTGSGKTITSFKTALFLSTRAGFDKIVFLVDRRELDKNTREKFQAYAEYEPVDVDETKHTYILRNKLISPKNGIVVTTTFKLNSLVKSLVENSDLSLAKKKIVFIIDEAHRTTMGEMMRNITDYFKENSLFFGFTGTPLFDENNVKGRVNEKNEVIKTTEDLFGPELHRYTIDEAIRDRNVLAFHVSYINTGEFKSYEDLRDQLIELYRAENPNLSDRELQIIVGKMSDLEVEKEAKKRSLLYYSDETHIPQVVKDILENWEAQSQGRKFNALLTTGRIDRAIAYYKEFQKQLAGIENPIHIIPTFSFGSENDGETPAKAYEETLFLDYEKISGIRFLPNDPQSEQEFFEDLVERIPNGGSGRGEHNIDLAIVADQLLTGFDSKLLNTLYVDRSLELQGLVQAYSRTNRVLGHEKEFGSILNYQYPELTREAVNKALELYGSGGKNSPAIVEPYETAVKRLQMKIQTMRMMLEDPARWKDLETDEAGRKRFAAAYKEAAEQLNKVAQYYEFAWDDEAFGCDQHTWQKYTGAFKNLTHKTPPPLPPVAQIVGKLKLVAADEITAEYILKLIGKKIPRSSDVKGVDDESLRLILEKIQELSDLGEADKADQLRSFVADIQAGNVPAGKSIEESFTDWRSAKAEEEAERYAQKWGADVALLLRSLAAYDTEKPEYIPLFDRLCSTLNYQSAEHKEEDALDQSIFFRKETPGWLAKIKRQYY